MSFDIINAGLQTSLQGRPFAGHRHIGMPAAGAADSLSLALANRLVCKAHDDVAIEITLTDALLEAREDIVIAVVGSAQFLRINGTDHRLHESIPLAAGDRLHIGPSHPGCRSYLAISAAINADHLLGGGSTYLAAGLGGFAGRALRAGDRLASTACEKEAQTGCRTPTEFRPRYGESHVVRIVAGPEAVHTGNASLDSLCKQPFSIDPRASRMGMALAGPRLDEIQEFDMPSAAVFPGTIQLPPSGQPYLLGPDAQTTGGYPRIAQVIRADRHVIGQLAPGAKIQFVQTSPARAAEIYREKLSRLTDWLGQINLW